MALGQVVNTVLIREISPRKQRIRIDFRCSLGPPCEDKAVCSEGGGVGGEERRLISRTAADT